MLLPLLFILGMGQTATRAGVPAHATPATDPGTWLSDDDYPPAALRLGESGTVAFRLIVRRDGGVKACEVTVSASAVLDQRTCDLLTLRAKFHPATDAAGKAIEGRWQSRINWMLPPHAPIPADNWHSLATVELDGAGVPLSCKPELTGSVRERGGVGQCNAYPSGYPQPALAKLGSKPGSPQTFVVENGLEVEGGPGPTPIFRYLAKGQKLIGVAKVGFEISPTGQIENCRPIATGSEGPLVGFLKGCAGFEGGFIPLRGADGNFRRGKGAYTFAISIPQ